MIDEKQQELFTAWADREFGPSLKLPQIQRYASYWKCWQAALVSQPKPKPIPSYELVMMYAEMPRSDNEMIEFARELECEVLHRIGYKQQHG